MGAVAVDSMFTGMCPTVLQTLRLMGRFFRLVSDSSRWKVFGVIGPDERQMFQLAEQMHRYEVLLWARIQNKLNKFYHSQADTFLTK